MSELSNYYHDFCSGHWARTDASECRCRGNGWALSEVDTWHRCPVHYNGQPHPEDIVVEEEWAQHIDLRGTKVTVEIIGNPLEGFRVELFSYLDEFFSPGTSYLHVELFESRADAEKLAARVREAYQIRKDCWSGYQCTGFLKREKRPSRVN